MRKSDIFWIALLTAVLSLLLLKAIAAIEMMPVAAAFEADLVDHAFDMMVKVTVPIFSLVLVTMLVSLYRFVVRDGCPLEEGIKIHSSRGGFVEAIWILASLILTLGLAAYGSKELRLLRGTDIADLDIQVNASQWSWEFYYPKYNQFASELILPKDKRVRLLLTSKDVVHAFWVPEFRVKQDALPGKVVKLLFTPTKAGEYQLLCAELCGTEHTVMTAKVRVVEAEEFEQKIKGEAW